MASRVSRTKDERVQIVQKELEDAGRWHPDYCRKVDSWYKTWRGVLESKSEAAQWKSRLHPPYAMQVADTILANIVDDRLRYTVKPRPRIESDLQHLEMLAEAARFHEILMNDQLDRERFLDKLSVFYLQAVIAGLSVFKQSWRRSTKRVVQRSTSRQPVPDPFAGVAMVDVATVEEREITLYEGPWSEVVDVRDFWWYPEGAVSLDRASSVCHRVFVTMDELRRLEAQGVYSNVDAISESRDYSSVLDERERGLFNVSRTRDMVEVIERWTRDRVIAVANRKVVLRDEPNPFWHGDVPFVTCTLKPDLFRIPGISDIENIRDLQTALWKLMNQRLDNTELVNNAIVMFRSDFDDPDSFEFGPAARNIVDDPSQVVLWTPNPLSAQISIPAEQSIRGDIQNITSAAPFASGADSSTVDQQTATGVSIITTLAQRMMAFKKSHGLRALDRVFDQRMWLNYQFAPEEQLVRNVGPDGVVSYETIRREDLSPDCYFESEPANETLMTQQRRAESQARMQTALQIAPVLAAIAQGDPEAKSLNVERFVEDWLRAWGVDNTAPYFSARPQPLVQGVPGQVSQPGFDQQQGQNGVTSSFASDQLSPSNVDTMSPVAAMHRMLSQTGMLQ